MGEGILLVSYRWIYCKVDAHGLDRGKVEWLFSYATGVLDFSKNLPRNPIDNSVNLRLGLHARQVAISSYDIT